MTELIFPFVWCIFFSILLSVSMRWDRPHYHHRTTCIILYDERNNRQIKSKSWTTEKKCVERYFKNPHTQIIYANTRNTDNNSCDRLRLEEKCFVFFFGVFVCFKLIGTSVLIADVIERAHKITFNYWPHLFGVEFSLTFNEKLSIVLWLYFVWHFMSIWKFQVFKTS